MLLPCILASSAVYVLLTCMMQCAILASALPVRPTTPCTCTPLEKLFSEESVVTHRQFLCVTYRLLNASKSRMVCVSTGWSYANGKGTLSILCTRMHVEPVAYTMFFAKTLCGVCAAVTLMCMLRTMLRE